MPISISNQVIAWQLDAACVCNQSSFFAAGALFGNPLISTMRNTRGKLVIVRNSQAVGRDKFGVMWMKDGCEVCFQGLSEVLPLRRAHQRRQRLGVPESRSLSVTAPSQGLVWR